MRSVIPSPLLRLALLVDIVLSAATALLQLVATDWLAANLSLSRALLFESGLFMLGYVLALIVLVRRERMPSVLVRAVAIGNVGWALLCVAFLVSGMQSPGKLGIGYVLLQADLVLVFAAMQWRGLTRSTVVGSSGTHVNA